MSIQAIITDIEGTTTAIDFVHQTLFPYARQRLRAFVAANPAQVAPVLADMSALAGKALSSDEACTLLEHWIDTDQKITPLKTLQGWIWQQGYAAGELLGHVYDDVPPALQRWKDAGMRLFVYSSGSVAAQKLIFGHTAFGDLTPHFEGYFDTRIGAKREVASYEAIVAQIGLPAERCLFLSDIGAELDAARAASLQTRQLLRDATAVRYEGHVGWVDFSAI